MYHNDLKLKKIVFLIFIKHNMFDSLSILNAVNNNRHCVVKLVVVSGLNHATRYFIFNHENVIFLRAIWKTWKKSKA